MGRATWLWCLLAPRWRRIEVLEREKIRLAEWAESAVPSEARLSEFVEPALTFLANPWDIY